MNNRLKTSTKFSLDEETSQVNHKKVFKNKL